MEVLIFVFDWILRIAGLLSILVAISSLILSKDEYIENVKIKFLGPFDSKIHKDILKEVRYYHEYHDKDIYGESTFFKPNSCNIKYLKVFEIDWDIEKERLVIKKCLETFKNIEHDTGVLLDIYYVEGIPNRKIVWKSDYGITGEHIFEYNGFNGNVDTTIYKYKFNIFNKIRKLIGWK